MGKNLVCFACVHSLPSLSGDGESNLLTEEVLLAMLDLAHGAKVLSRGCFPVLSRPVDAAAWFVVSVVWLFFTDVGNIDSCCSHYHHHHYW